MPTTSSHEPKVDEPRRRTVEINPPASLRVTAQSPRRVEVTGATAAEIRRSLDVARRLERVVGSARAGGGSDGRGAFDQLVELLADLDETLPPTSVIQAERNAEHRLRLVASGSYSHEDLRRLRSDGLVSSTRTWVSRQQNFHHLFTVTHQGRTVVPAFLLDADLKPRRELRRLLLHLFAAQVPEWQRWTWLTTGTTALGGRSPQAVAREDPDRAVAAAKRFAARVHPPSAA